MFRVDDLAETASTIRRSCDRQSPDSVEADAPWPTTHARCEVFYAARVPRGHSTSTRNPAAKR